MYIHKYHKNRFQNFRSHKNNLLEYACPVKYKYKETYYPFVTLPIISIDFYLDTKFIPFFNIYICIITKNLKIKVYVHCTRKDVATLRDN